jgi:predicted RNase H-like nuclease (RuvC/YqgF family)
MPSSRKKPSLAEQSAVAAIQEVLDQERVAAKASELRHARQIEALQGRIGELEAELAQAAARIRELEARLQARSR